MAKHASRTPTQSTIATEKPSHRVFKDRPSGVYIDEFGKHVKATGCPETYPGLYQDKIARDAEFKLLRKFSIDRKKRPNGDMAFCPRCGHEDKFLHGDLAWFPKLQVCAAIGHCCASHEARADAEREFKWREKLRYEEDYLLAALPLLGRQFEIIQELKPDCAEALRIYRQFRLQAMPAHSDLRRLKDQFSGHLMVTSVIGGAPEADQERQNDYVGPAGFRGKGRYNVDTRDTDLGLMAGLVALNKDFNPVKELTDIERMVASFDLRPGEAAALDFIISMSNEQRRAAVAILQSSARKFRQLVERLDEFWSFFSPDNLAAIQRYAEHPDAVFYVNIERQITGGKTIVRISNRNFSCRLVYAPPRSVSGLEWPMPSSEEGD